MLKKHPTYPGRKKSGGNPSLAIAVVLLLLVAVVLGIIMYLEKSGYAQNSSSLPDSPSRGSSLSSVQSSSQPPVSSQEPSSGEPSSEPSSQTPSSQAAGSQTPVSSQSGTVTQTGDWRLILVNRQNLLPEDFSVNLEVASNNLLMDSRVVQAAQDFMAAAKNAGYPLQLISGYRSIERQTTLYNNKVNELLKAGYSQADAEEEAAKWNAIPRTSEHHTGLACDLITVDYYNYFSDLVAEFDTTDAFKWMAAHCAEYGFVLRYGKDKTDITGITYEPWHYRYVGVENAKYMTEHNLCLEEYVEYLNSQQ